MKKLLVLLLITLGTARLFAQQNVVFIIADDLGTDYLGFYDDGLDTANMPHVRSLLAAGVRFTRAWSFPYCSEIRAAALTGRYPFRTGWVRLLPLRWMRNWIPPKSVLENY